MKQFYFELMIDHPLFGERYEAKTEQFFTVSAETVAVAWDMAEREAEVRSFRFGKHFEYILTRDIPIDEGSES